MPSITYLEENNPKERGDHGAPEPPARYDADSSGQSKFAGRGNDGYPDELASIRRLVTAAQVMALVSLLVGGVILSSAALVTAAVASSRIRGCHDNIGNDGASWLVLKRSSTVAIVMAALALAANIAALIVIYPLVMEVVQSGDYSALMSGSPQGSAPGTGSGSSTWG